MVPKGNESLRLLLGVNHLFLKGTNGRHKTYEIFHVYCIFYSGFMCQTTVIFGITKDGSLVLIRLSDTRWKLSRFVGTDDAHMSLMLPTWSGLLTFGRMSHDRWCHVQPFSLAQANILRYCHTCRSSL